MTATIVETSIDPVHNRLAILGADGNIRLWSLETAELLRTIERDASHICFTPDKDQLLVGERVFEDDCDYLVCILDLQSGQILHEIKIGHAGDEGEDSTTFQVLDIAIAPENGNVLINTSSELVILNASLATELLKYDKSLANGATIYYPEFGLYALAEDNKIVVFDVNRAVRVNSLAINSEISPRLLFSKDAKEIIFSLAGNNVKDDETRPSLNTCLAKWDFTNNVCQKSPNLDLGTRNDDPIEELCLHRKNQAVAIQTERALYSLSGFDQAPELFMTMDTVAYDSSLAYCEQGEYLVLCRNIPCSDTGFGYSKDSDAELIRLDDVSPMKENFDYEGLSQLRGDGSSRGALSYLEHLDQLIVRRKYSVEIWNSQTLRLQHRIFQHKSEREIDVHEYFRETSRDFEFNDWIEDSKFSPDGRMIGVVGETTGLSSALLYHSDGRPLTVLQTFIQDRASWLAFSNDSRQVVVDYECEGLSLLDTENGCLRHQLTSHSSCGHHFSQSDQTLKFSPDNTLLAAGFSEGSAWIWDCKSGELLHAVCATGMEAEQTLSWQAFSQTPPEQDIDDEELMEIHSLVWIDNQHLLIGTEAGLYLWKLDRKEVVLVDAAKAHALALWQNPAGAGDTRFAVHNHSKNEIKIFDAAHQAIATLEDVGYTCTKWLAFSQDGNWIHTARHRFDWQNDRMIRGRDEAEHLSHDLLWDGVSETVQVLGHGQDCRFFKVWPRAFHAEQAI